MVTLFGLWIYTVLCPFLLSGCMIPQDVHTMIPREEIASLEPVQTVKRIVQVASLPPATPQAGHIL